MHFISETASFMVRYRVRVRSRVRVGMIFEVRVGMIFRVMVLFGGRFSSTSWEVSV